MAIVSGGECKLTSLLSNESRIIGVFSRKPSPLGSNDPSFGFDHAKSTEVDVPVVHTCLECPRPRSRPRVFVESFS